MADERFKEEDTLVPSAAVDIEHRVADFRAAWERGSRPAISDCLKDVPPPSQPKLFRELLQIEFACRLEKKDPPTLSEYLSLFPQNGDVVKQLFDEHFKGPDLKGYEHLELLGGGGMGIVYKARQTTLGRTVAIKFLAENALKNQKMIARFRQESHSIGQLNHENIVQAYDAGEDGGRQFLVMEFVDGACLSDLIRARGGLPAADVCQIARQVCNGLEYARKKGVVHRDIKPSNLMLTAQGVVKILDFGLACIKLDREDSQGLTTDGCAMGTLDYMAPEQFDARSVDHRADIYSLGCTMFSLLTGRPPFGLPEYSSDIAKMKAHALEPTPRADAARSDVPRAVADIVCRMMAKHRDDRYETAAAVAEALAPLAAGADLAELAGKNDRSVAAADTKTHSVSQTLRDHRPTTRPRFDRLIAYCRKRPRIVAGAMGGLVLVAVLLAILAVRIASKPKVVRFEDAIATLPGLDGNWWFNEIPWLTPAVRQQWIDRASEHVKSADPNSIKESDFGERVKSLTDDLNGLNLKALKSSLYYDPIAAKDENRRSVSMVGIATLPDYYKNLDRVRRLLAVSPAPADPKDSSLPAPALSAADEHLLALVCHRLANLPDSARPQSKTSGNTSSEAPAREELWDIAMKHYKLAAAAYERQINYPMQALCLADCGQLAFDRQDNSAALERLTSALAVLGNQGLRAPFFEVYVNCSCADACCELGSLAEAKGFIKQSENSASLLPENHPLRAYVKERKAWYFMDALDPENASKCFQEAIGIRDEVGKIPDNDKISERIFVFHDRHGLALAEQYRATLLAGISPEERKVHLKASQRQFDRLLQDMKSVFDNPPEELKLRAVEDLKDRWTNSAERDADGYLFGDPTADPQDFRRAAQRYRDAYKPLQDERSSLVANLLLKETIAWACTRDPRHRETAGKCLESAQTILKSLGQTEQDRLDFARFVAVNVLQWKQAAERNRAIVKRDIIKGLAELYRKALVHQTDRRDVHLLRDQKLLDNLLDAVVEPGKLHDAAMKQARRVNSEN
jgi:serine/threonine protein kinase